MKIGNWFKDDLPDLLWPALVLAERGPESIRGFVHWQRAVQEALETRDDGGWIAERLDGRLTSLEVLAEKYPEAVAVVVTEAHHYGLLEERVRHALASFPDMPARWIVDEPQTRAPEREVLELIRDALLGVMQNRHQEALIKCLRTWSTVQAGTFRASDETIDLLKDYPVNLEKRAQADTAVRAMWGGHKGLLELEESGHFDKAIKWAQAFWWANSVTTACVRKRDLNKSDDASGAEAGVDADGVADADPERAASEAPEGGAHLQGLVMDLLSSFVEALETSPADLHQQQRQEVVSGLVSSAGRQLIAVLGAPSLWSLEHGAHIGRMLVEIEIYVHWMARQSAEIFTQFQEYGFGKAKLYSKIFEELPEDSHTAGFRESVDELKRLSRNDTPLDLRTVDTRDTFADGKSIRAMAEEGGLLDFYRHAYSMSSGVVHSEWWSIELHAMEPCLNVLHGMHLIPSLSINPGGNLDLARAWVNQFHALVQDGMQLLQIDTKAAANAFAWLEAEEPAEPVDATKREPGL